MPTSGQTLKQDYGTNEEENLGYTTNISATGAGAGGAVILKTKHNLITVSIPNGSVKFQDTGVGFEYYMTNATANTIQFYTKSNTLGGNIGAGFTVWARCVAVNKWIYVVTATSNE